MDFTSPIVPQQSFSEITVSFDVLRSISLCNFLVFGLCHDSLMWASFNTCGKMLFLVEDPTWVQTVLKDTPNLNATVVKYRTKLSEAGVTHVFLHDVNRKVDKAYANEFLCEKYRKHAIGRLWHFEIPPTRNVTSADGWFC
ncbi:hypothetical protein L6452_17406 [Arctium lappa]|uniref:Uncharacterized protein n=1 Tax=Arctium lappa TaxID=4217 RepID=A0ACB9C3B1_ARCLA|nr:hypothetical protein L6452_17406 [Arctium lappa]